MLGVRLNTTEYEIEDIFDPQKGIVFQYFKESMQVSFTK